MGRFSGPSNSIFAQIPATKKAKQTLIKASDHSYSAQREQYNLLPSSIQIINSDAKTARANFEQHLYRTCDIWNPGSPEISQQNQNFRNTCNIYIFRSDCFVAGACLTVYRVEWNRWTISAHQIEIGGERPILTGVKCPVNYFNGLLESELHSTLFIIHPLNALNKAAHMEPAMRLRYYHLEVDDHANEHRLRCGWKIKVHTTT